ncbi:MAG: S41 family peptidase [Gemmataceae bacterium]|nr:S41 family peptidase [Gemmataceae bacterium]
MNRWNLAWLIGIPAAVIFGLTVSFSAPVSREHEQDYELIRLIAEVLNEVDHTYVRELNPDQRRQLVENMVTAGLEQLDPHSTYFNEREYKSFGRKSKGKFGGVGVQVTMDRRAGALLVSSPMVGTPAYEAGIQPGDMIVKVNGVPLDHKRSTEAVELILGEPGTPVTLSVVHEGESVPVDITMNRAVIEVPTILGDLRRPEDPKQWDLMYDKEKKIGYIRIVEFDEPTAAEFRKAVADLEAEGARGLVIDVRGNPGGLLTAAVEVVDTFVSEGTIVSTKNRRPSQNRNFSAVADNDLMVGKPIAILVDRYSASASEIVSSALQDHGRAVVVGERSYGKGTVQNVHPIEDGKSALKLTIASYWRPSNKNIHRFPEAQESDDWGVRPTKGYEVTLNDDERKAWLEGRRARDIVPGKSGAMPDKLRARVEGPFIDKALDVALKYVREAAEGKAK